MNKEREIVDKIIDFECGLLNDSEALELFSDLIATKTAWNLQGSYGRTASKLIEDGYIDEAGNILIDMEEL